MLAGGQGWRLGDLKGHIATLQIEPFARLTGYVSNVDLAQLYGQARFLAMPSLYEGFGFPIIEANAMGIPVLTLNTSSMPEVAGDASILVDPNDVQSIGGGLESLATDNVLLARLASPRTQERMPLASIGWKVRANWKAYLKRRWPSVANDKLERRTSMPQNIPLAPALNRPGHYALEQKYL